MDDELEALRAKRMAELQSEMGGGPGGGMNDQQKQQAEAQERRQEMMNSILAQVLDQSARARLNSIALVKPEKAKMVESMLCQMATTGQLPGRIGEEQLKSLLERVSEQTKKTTKVKMREARFKPQLPTSHPAKHGQLQQVEVKDHLQQEIHLKPYELQGRHLNQSWNSFVDCLYERRRVMDSDDDDY